MPELGLGLDKKKKKKKKREVRIQILESHAAPSRSNFFLRFILCNVKIAHGSLVATCTLHDWSLML